MRIFEVQNLTCERGEVRVFSGIAFTLSAGQLLALHGPNGAGKSSLLRVISGLLRPAAGELIADGMPIGSDWPAFQARLHYSGHLDGVKPALSVIENLQFWTQLSGGTAEAAAGALDRLGIGNLADMPARFLSAGQKRRLALARLVAIPRELWLLDEPTAALDTEAMELFAQLVQAHLSGGGMAIATTHTDLGLVPDQTLSLARP